MEKKAMITKVAELLMTDAKDILLMLGIETEFDYEERSGMVYFTSKPISMTPRMFKELRIRGHVYYTDITFLPKAILELEYYYKLFGGGSNSSNLGIIEYALDEHIDEQIEQYSFESVQASHSYNRINMNLGMY